MIMAGISYSAGGSLLRFVTMAGLRHSGGQLIVGFYDYGEGSALRRVAHC